MGEFFPFSFFRANLELCDHTCAEYILSFLKLLVPQIPSTPVLLKGLARKVDFDMGPGAESGNPLYAKFNKSPIFHALSSMQTLSVCEGG